MSVCFLCGFHGGCATSCRSGNGIKPSLTPAPAPDRLEEIRALYSGRIAPWQRTHNDSPAEDVRWLIAEVDRLRIELKGSAR